MFRESMPQLEGQESKPDYEREAEFFLGDKEIAMVGGDALKDAFNSKKEEEARTEAKLSSINAQSITYNKYKKSFFIGEEKVTAGEILSSRHFNIPVAIPDSTALTFEGKKLKDIYIRRSGQDVYTSSLNKVLAGKLAEDTYKKDRYISQAYKKIAEREGETSEQLGVIAEKVMVGIAEMISIDRPDLMFEIHPANAYQDVEEKIDFILSTRTKKRGVGTEAKEDIYDERNFGIQFTINTSKKEFKEDQIAKAKERGVDVDDILYVALDSKILRDALTSWEAGGKSVKGPWHYLPTNTKREALKNLFSGILPEDKVESLVKGVQ